VVATELLVAWAAILIAAVWIIKQQLELNAKNDVLESAEEALEQASEAVDIYQHVLRDVAMGQATLEVTNDGNIIATHRSLGKVSLH
jgi:hypothetical protein